jgi:hypothetical protein
LRDGPFVGWQEVGTAHVPDRLFGDLQTVRLPTGTGPGIQAECQQRTEYGTDCNPPGLGVPQQRPAPALAQRRPPATRRDRLAGRRPP